MSKCIVCRAVIKKGNLPICEICKKNPFRVEDARNFFAKNNQIGLLKKTYEVELSEIPNINTPLFWDGLFSSKTQKSPITIDRSRRILNMIASTRGKILDVGFGEGFIEELLSKYLNYEICGIDISKIAVERIKKKIKGDFRMGSILNIPFPDNFFDVVLVIEVLEHISPKRVLKAYKELSRVLKKKGLLIVSVPLNEDLRRNSKKKKEIKVVT